MALPFTISPPTPQCLSCPVQEGVDNGAPDWTSCVTMTHVLWSATVNSLYFDYMWNEEGVRAWALMQCFPTLPPPPSPQPSSLLCTVDDSDPGQSSETWGERLVPPCRIYAGNRCSPILGPPPHFSSSSFESRHARTHSALLGTHMHVCVFPRLASAPVTAQHVCFVTTDWAVGGGLGECRLHFDWL